MSDWNAALKALGSIAVLFLLIGFVTALAYALIWWEWKAVVAILAAYFLIWFWNANYQEFKRENQHKARSNRSPKP